MASTAEFTKTNRMEVANTQVLFFQYIKSMLPPHVSLVDELADILDISNDSVYRRIRGEKPISLEEMKKLAVHFNLSIDQFLHLNNNAFIFSGDLANNKDHIFEHWLENLLRQMQFIHSFRQKHMYYLAKDLPIMTMFLSPELLAFKCFFWRKSILHLDDLRRAKFSFADIDPQHVEFGKKIADVYRQIPSTEIWNLESINSIIRQIEFYREANVFEKEEDVRILYRSVIGIINHVEKEAEYGLKFFLNEEPRPNSAEYQLFNNELILGDNTILAEVDNSKITFLNHSAINYISTQDERFNTHMHHSLQNLVRKATQLSKVGEKDRARFFNRIRDKMKLAARL